MIFEFLDSIVHRFEKAIGACQMESKRKHANIAKPGTRSCRFFLRLEVVTAASSSSFLSSSALSCGVGPNQPPDRTCRKAPTRTTVQTQPDWSGLLHRPLVVERAPQNPRPRSAPRAERTSHSHCLWMDIPLPHASSPEKPGAASAT